MAGLGDHARSAIFLAVVASLGAAGFAWMASLARDIGGMVTPVAGQMYQEAKTTRVSVPSRDR